MCYRSSVVCLKSSQYLEGRRKNSHDAIVTSKEEVLGSRAHAADFAVLEEGLALIVRRIDLADFEEIERFPL
jgi:hypothetical protein